MEEIRIDLPDVTRNELRHWTRDGDGWKYQDAFNTVDRFKTRISVQTVDEAKALYWQLDTLIGRYSPKSAGSYVAEDGNVAKAMKRIRKELVEKTRKQGIDVKEIRE